jgi:hypothetical protein
MPATRFYYGVLRAPHSARPWQVIGVSRRDLFVHGNYKSKASARAQANALNNGRGSAVVDTLAKSNNLLQEVQFSGSTAALWAVFSVAVDPEEKPHALKMIPVQKHWAG